MYNTSLTCKENLRIKKKKTEEKEHLHIIRRKINNPVGKI